MYKILALFGEQGLALEFTGGRIRDASPRAAAQPGGPSLIERRFAEYLKGYRLSLGETDAEVAQMLRQNYAQWFAAMQTPGSVRKIGSHDLRLLFRAACIVSAMHDVRYAQDAQMDFAEMGKRHFVGWPDYQQMYQALVDTRQFAAVHKFYQAHSGIGLTPLPDYRDETKSADKGAPAILMVSTIKHELVRRPVNLNKPVQVVILADPNCHFCADLDAALQSHPKLREALQQNTIWVTPPGSELEFDTLQQWNKAHPHMRLAIMYSLQGWPMVKIMAVPQFFFLRHGKVVRHRMGCGTQCDLSALRSGLKAIGLWK